MEGLIDLHTHTNHSDGVLTPLELVALAARRGVEVLALTDHDCTSGCAAAAAACREAGIGFVPGVELTCTWLEREIHVVALGVATDSAPLVAHLERVVGLRRERIGAIGARLRAAGLRFRNDVVSGPGGRQILLDDPAGNPIELFQPAGG